jgi:8-oxo-dGTP pyrophosphatase MutT (NUDIX family)
MNLRRVEDQSFGIIPLAQENGTWKVLLILHQGGRHWAFPKGHENEGETAQAAASRELNEETGLEVEQFLQEEPLVEQYQFHRKNEIVIKTVKYFPATVKGNLKLQKEEIKDAKWVPLNEASKHLTFKEARSMCQELIKILNV